MERQTPRKYGSSGNWSWPHRAGLLTQLTCAGKEGAAKQDLSQTSMRDYETDVRTVINSLQDAPVVMGWSLGGLIAMMVAASGDAKACIALAPSMPARSQDTSVPLRHGEFGPEEYGIVGDDPEDQPAMLNLDLEERKIALILWREGVTACQRRKESRYRAWLVTVPAFDRYRHRGYSLGH